MNVTVNMAAGFVAVDGVALQCSFPINKTIRSIRWHGETLYGNVVVDGPEVVGGEFRDPAVITPYVTAWRAEMQRRLDAAATAATKETADYQAWLVSEAGKTQLQMTAAAADATAAAARVKPQPQPRKPAAGED
jgi:hypothetical protein